MTLSNRKQIQLWSGTDLDALAKLTSAVIDTKFMTSVALVYRAANAGGGVTAGVKVSYAVSPDGVNFGSFDNVLVADTSAVSIEEDWHEVAVSHKARYIQIQIEELKGHNNDVIDVNLVFVETI